MESDSKRQYSLSWDLHNALKLKIYTVSRANKQAGSHKNATSLQQKLGETKLFTNNMVDISR